MISYYAIEFSPIVHLCILLRSKTDVPQRSSAVTTPVNKRPIVECPYCHSTNTEKISAVSKGVAPALFGVFSLSRNSKQWHCNNCKSDF